MLYDCRLHQKAAVIKIVMYYTINQIKGHKESGETDMLPAMVKDTISLQTAVSHSGQ